MTDGVNSIFFLIVPHLFIIVKINKRYKEFDVLFYWINKWKEKIKIRAKTGQYRQITKRHNNVVNT
jgi:hypothetical protein